MTGDPTPRWSGPDGEPTLADVQREFTDWHCWRAISGLLHARHTSAETGEPATLQGEDPLDLRDQIIRANAQRAHAEYASTHRPASHPGPAARPDGA